MLGKLSAGSRLNGQLDICVNRFDSITIMPGDHNYLHNNYGVPVIPATSNFIHLCVFDGATLKACISFGIDYAFEVWIYSQLDNTWHKVG